MPPGPGPAKRFVFGDSFRGMGRAIGGALLLTTGLTLTLLLLQWLGQATGAGMWILTSIPPKPGWWSDPWLDRLFFLAMAGWGSLAFLLGLQHAASDGGFVGTTALIGSIPLGSVLYHRIIIEYPTLFFPEVLHDSSGIAYNWRMVELYFLTDWVFVALVVLSLVVMAFGRWIGERGSLRPQLTVVAGCWLGTFVAGFLLHVLQQGFLITPHLEWVTREPTLEWTRRMIMDYLPFVAWPVWVATVGAVLGWLALSGYRWTGARIGFPRAER